MPGDVEAARSAHWRSNFRQDIASGALGYVSSTYRTDDGARHQVRSALRRSIGEAYGAFVGHVDHIPRDDYGCVWVRTLWLHGELGLNMQQPVRRSTPQRLHLPCTRDPRAAHAHAPERYARDCVLHAGLLSMHSTAPCHPTSPPAC